MRAIVVLGALLVAGSAIAAPAPAKKTAKPDPVAESYAAMPLPDRVAVQADLIWTGDYNGAADGEFGERAVAAVKAFQKRNEAKETGVLNPQEQADLAAAAKAKQESVGWRLLDDAATGARLGVPGKLVPQSGRTATGGRWASARGEVQVETFRIAEPGTSLKAVFDEQRTVAGRKVAYNVLRPDFFVVSGLQGLKKFYVRAQLKDAEVRGFTVLHDQAMEGTMDPVVIAMSNAFTAFPIGLAAAPPPKRKVEYGTAIVVSAEGLVLVGASIADGCNVMSVAGYNADLIAKDKQAGLALLRVYGANELQPIARATASPRGQAATIVGVADPQAQGGRSAVASAAVRLVDDPAGVTRIEPTPALGFAGAAAVDETGRLVGSVALNAAIVAAASAGPGSQAELIPVGAINKFLAAHGVALPTSDPSTPAQAKAAIARIICVRK